MTNHQKESYTLLAGAGSQERLDFQHQLMKKVLLEAFHRLP